MRLCANGLANGMRPYSITLYLIDFSIPFALQTGRVIQLNLLRTPRDHDFPTIHREGLNHHPCVSSTDILDMSPTAIRLVKNTPTKESPSEGRIFILGNKSAGKEALMRRVCMITPNRPLELCTLTLRRSPAILSRFTTIPLEGNTAVSRSSMGRSIQSCSPQSSKK